VRDKLEGLGTESVHDPFLQSPSQVAFEAFGYLIFMRKKTKMRKIVAKKEYFWKCKRSGKWKISRNKFP
jgi:hypothetical protein